MPLDAFTRAQDRASEIADQITRLVQDDEGNARELDDADTEALRSLNDELASHNEIMDRLRAVQKNVNRSNEIIADTPNNGLDIKRPSKVAAVSKMRSFGEFWIGAKTGELARTEVDSVAEMMSHKRALADQTTTNLTGILPPTWLTDIVDFIDNSRPFINAFDVRPLPDSGLVINYPRVTTKPSIAAQASQKTDVASRATVITTQSASVGTYAGGEDIAIQALERTDPGYLGIVLELYAEQMSVTMDTAAIAVASAAVTGGNEITIATATEEIATRLAAAAKIVYSARLGPPDAFVISLDVWEILAGSVDADGRPLFPDMAASNPAGSSGLNTTSGSARGVNWVVDPNLTGKKAFLGNSRAFTSFVGPVRTLTADVPSKLGYDAAVFSMAAFAVRRPDAIVEITFT